ncbi:MAG: PhoU domain-containing protein [Nitriliruptor sp.]|uniref:PhoU domain-containing protein n=1 Tax=Nitriliruptor sp. TaxID=2448056 RepID=UPI0034A04D0D
MSWRSLFSGGGVLRDVEQLLVDMLRLDQRSYELAHQALLEGGDVAALRREISDTDHQVNLAEQQVRRQLVIHASVNESIADIPAMFVYMSIVKDIERIGDYAKNILDIARARTGRSDLGALAEVSIHRERVAELLAEVAATLEQRDADRAQRLLDASYPSLAELDRLVDELTISDEPGHVVVPRALYYRYLKRITAHLQNVLTSLTAPVDRLDFQG